VTEDLRTVILKNGTTSEIREMAQTQGMKTLRQSGLMKVIEGTTTVEEVLRVTLST
jgi:type II secretory ATPase GspE/PulE/Tfp pilus assembly ATPase PilB-like protein